MKLLIFGDINKLTITNQLLQYYQYIDLCVPDQNQNLPLGIVHPIVSNCLFIVYIVQIC